MFENIIRNGVFLISPIQLQSTCLIDTVSESAQTAFRPFKCGVYKDSCLVWHTKLKRVEHKFELQRILCCLPDRAICHVYTEVKSSDMSLCVTILITTISLAFISYVVDLCPLRARHFTRRNLDRKASAKQ